MTAVEGQRVPGTEPLLPSLNHAGWALVDPRDTSGPPARPPGRRAVRLLEADPDLGSGLSGRQLTDARRHAVVPALALAPGEWHDVGLQGVPAVHGSVLGFLVLRGALTLDAGIARRSSSRLLAAGDLILLDDDELDSVPDRWAWSVLAPTQVAVLDERVLRYGQRWPALIGAIMRRAGRQIRRAHAHQAISQFPRVEDRLLALFSSMADQVGVVRLGEVRIPLALTHQALACMIGARRPTVTLALKGLAEHGLLTRDKTGWSLSRRAFEQMAAAD